MNSHARWLVVEHTSELTKWNKVRGMWTTRILVAVLRFYSVGKKAGLRKKERVGGNSTAGAKQKETAESMCVLCV